MYSTPDQTLALIERVTDRIVASMPGMERPAVRHMVATALARLGTAPLPTDDALMDEAYLIEYVPGTGTLEGKSRKPEERAARRERFRDQPWRKGHA